MTTRRKWRVLWRRIKISGDSRYERGKRESISFIRAIFMGPHFHKDWHVELLRVLQVHFHHVFFFSKEGDSDPPYSMRNGYENKASILVTLAKHTGHQNWSWGVIRIVICFSSYCQVLAGTPYRRLPLLTWLIDGCRLRHCVARLASEVTCGRLPFSWLIDGCRLRHCVVRLASEVTCGRLPFSWLIDGSGR